jgi:hypothetical protein
MTEEEQAPQEEEEAPPASSDSDAVQAALAGIPGLSDSVGSRPAARTGTDSMNEMMNESDSDQEPMSFGTPKKPVEDSEAVQQALKQLGLQ